MVDEYKIFMDNFLNLKNDINNYENIYIFGAGIYGRRLFKALAENDIHIKGFVVSSKVGNPIRIGRYYLMDIHEVSTAPEQSVFILAMKEESCQDAIKSLKEKGYTNYINPPKEKSHYENLRFLPKLEITTRIGCSVNCRFCPQELFMKTYMSGQNEKTLMSLDVFKRCIDKTPYNTVITFSGFCEPFLNESCAKMIEYAVSVGREVELYTTLVQMKMEDFDKISKLPIKTVVLHTPDEMEWAKIPMTDDYFEVLDKVLEHTRENGTPWVDSANCQGVPAQMFREFAGNRVVVESDLCDRAGNLEENEVRKSTGLSGSLKCSKMNDLNQWVLLPDGRVVLCCMDFGMEHVIGNLLEQSYDEILNGPELYKLRRAMNEGGDLLCRKCTSARIK